MHDSQKQTHFWELELAICNGVVSNTVKKVKEEFLTLVYRQKNLKHNLVTLVDQSSSVLSEARTRIQVFRF